MKQFKRAAVLFLAFFIILAGMPSPIMASDMIDFESYEDGSAFAQKFVEVKKVSTGKTGQKMTVSFVLVNPMTSTEMTNVKVRLATEKEFKKTFDIEDDEEDENSSTKSIPQYPFEFTSDISKEKDDIGTIKADGKRSVSMSYKVKRNLKEGYYPAVFYLSYGTLDRNREIPIGVNIWVTNSDSTTEEEKNKIDYDFTMGENQSTPQAAYGQVMEFGINLRNSGLKKVYDVRAYMQLDSDIMKFPFEINDGNYDRHLGDMEPDQVVTIPYSMGIRDKVKTGFYPISFKITYREDSGGDFVEPIDKVFFVNVTGKDDDELSADAGINERTKARLIVESFSTDPSEVYAGAPFTLNVRMKNASSNVQANNIMFTFSAEEVNNSPVFTTDTGSTSMVVNELAPGASTDLKLLFRPSPTAEQKSYTMTIKEKYDSPDFKNAEEEVKIAIPVKQEPRLNTGTIEVMPDTISVGAETNVMFGINNTGKVLLYNVMAKFEGDSIQTTDAYVGNIKPGETGNVDAMITGKAPTTDDGKVKITISFEDENGVSTKIEKEMSLIVTEEAEGGFDDSGDFDIEGTETAGKGKGGLSKAAIFTVVVIILISSGTAVVIKRKKKKEAAQEEGMGDEIS